MLGHHATHMSHPHVGASTVLTVAVAATAAAATGLAAILLRVIAAAATSLHLVLAAALAAAAAVLLILTGLEEAAGGAIHTANRLASNIAYTVNGRSQCITNNILRATYTRI